jgi:uncharacterized protein
LLTIPRNDDTLLSSFEDYTLFKEKKHSPIEKKEGNGLSSFLSIQEFYERKNVMTPHTIAHIEISAEDAPESAAFYHEVFGWEIATNPVHNYVTFQAASGLRGGFADPKEPTYEHGRVLVYLATDDIDATLAIIEAHGGKTEHPKVEIPHVGEWAVFTDPVGNRLALFKSKRSEPSQS